MVETLSAEAFYSQGKQGKLMGLRCEKGHVTAPPRHSCTTCQSLRLSPKELSGYGRVVEYTEVHSKAKDFPLETPYKLALVKLDEGPSLLGILEVKPQVEGARVRVRFRTLKEAERPRIFFEIQ